jgi:HEAT repeat protein
VRQGAAEALGQLGDVAVEPLIAVLMNGDRDVREAAAYGLRTIGTQEALMALGDRGFALS